MMIGRPQTLRRFFSNHRPAAVDLSPAQTNTSNKIFQYRAKRKELFKSSLRRQLENMGNDKFPCKSDMQAGA